jgi:hypothetical protein
VGRVKASFAAFTSLIKVVADVGNSREGWELSAARPLKERGGRRV